MFGWFSGFRKVPNPVKVPVFCINSGRAGSEYLANLLNTAANGYFEHEPEPQMIGQVLRLAENYPYPDTVSDRRFKAETLVAKENQLIQQYPRMAAWGETSHMFIKTYADVVVERFGERMKVIHLRRSPAQVLKSFVELRYFTEENPAWKSWMISPLALTRAIDPLPNLKTRDSIDWCIAYLIDIEARAQRFKAEYPFIPVYTTTLAALNDRSEVQRLFDWLALTPTAQTWKAQGKPVNERARRKADFNHQYTVEQAQSRLADYCREAQRVGIQLPDYFMQTVVLKP
jgi:hypothetical protein